MSNGCICCTLRDDLLQELTRLARDSHFDYLLIESTGISEPLPVATISATKNGVSLSGITWLDTMVTVVDCANLLQDYASSDFRPVKRVSADVWSAAPVRKCRR